MKQNEKSASLKKASHDRISEVKSTECGKEKMLPTKGYIVGFETKKINDVDFAELLNDLNWLFDEDISTNDGLRATTLSASHATASMMLMSRGTKESSWSPIYSASYAVKCFDPRSQAADFARTLVLQNSSV